MALGALDRFREVYDVDTFKKNKDLHLAFLLADQNRFFTQDALQLIKETGMEIPKRSFILAKQFEQAMKNL